MSGPGAGFEYPPTEVAWLKRDALLFAQSIGCTSDELHFLYVRIATILAAASADGLPGAPSQLCRLPYLPRDPPYVSPAMLQGVVALTRR